jgi:UDP-3-O-[3-hydroxymyristoyl] glucosamine N-acyltransferase
VNVVVAANARIGRHVILNRGASIGVDVTGVPARVVEEGVEGR